MREGWELKGRALAGGKRGEEAARGKGRSLGSVGAGPRVRGGRANGREREERESECEGVAQ